MTIAISQVNPATDNFLDWVTKTNSAINAISTNVITAGGANTVGLAYLTGTFTTTGLFANTISGGVYGTPAVLTFTSNVSFSSNVVFNGANNSFGAINNMHVIGATGQNRMVIANTTSNKLMFTTLLTEILAIDGAGSGIDADLLDGESNDQFVKVYGSTMTNGQSWGSTFASANSDITRHIMLYSNTYGFNATSTFINYVSPGNHRWMAGDTSLASLGTGSFSTSVPMYTPASVAGGAGIRVPHGTLPTTPTDGDIWSTTAGWFVRTNGATQQLLTMTYLQTIDGAASGLDADLLDGQQGAWYADIPARLGYTPVNKAGDAMGGGLGFGSVAATSNTDISRHVMLYSNTYGFNVTSGALNYVVSFVGGAHRFFVGTSPVLTANSTTFVSAVPVITPASIAGAAGVNIPHGVLPTTPVNGDVWSTTAGWFVRTNGATQQLLTMTYLQTIDGAASGLDADLLDGQQGTYYVDIPARLGYTPVNKAGDTMTGTLGISNTNPTVNFTSGANTVSLSSGGSSSALISSGTGFMRPHAQMFSSNVAVVSTAPTLIASYAKATYRSAKFVMSITNNNANAYTASELLVLHNGGDAFMSEYAVIHSNTSFGTFSANADATNVRLYFTSTSNNAVIKHDATYLTV